MSTEPSATQDQLERALMDMAIEGWRFARLFSRVLSKLDAGEAGRYVSQHRYFHKRLEDTLSANGLVLVNVEGQPYDAGIAATALNLADFGPSDVLIVDQMIEPIIMGSQGLRQQGTVMLRKVEV